MAKPTISQIIKSTLSAFIGVQSDKNLKQGSEASSMATYIAAGLVFTVLFVAAIIFVVSKVIGG